MNTLASESIASVDQSSRARHVLLRKQLRDRENQLRDRDSLIAQLQTQLDAKERVLAEMAERAHTAEQQVDEFKLQLTATQTDKVSTVAVMST